MAAAFHAFQHFEAAIVAYGDLVDTLRRLYFRRRAGEILPFQRVVIETTGLADPEPVLHTLMRDPLVSDCYRLDGVIATVDAVNGMDQLDRQMESVKQAAVADRLLLTKSDLAAAPAIAALEARLRKLNPAAPIRAIRDGRIKGLAISSRRRDSTPCGSPPCSA